ncbi:MAG: hypothetical protein GX132_01325 [Erysipelotrichia bacterium]|jgi:hypothetical protein|nr:hypothetical protein [Erysipelotrichia bacterium]
MNYFQKLKVLTIYDIFGRLRHFLRKVFGVLKRNAHINKKPKTVTNESILVFNERKLETLTQNPYVFSIFGKKYNLQNFYFRDAGDKYWYECKLPKKEDIKIEWEINRLQFLVPLAVNYKKTNNDKDLVLLNNLLLDWVSKNKFDRGINYYSNLEVAIRAISIYLIFTMIGDSLLKDVKLTDLLYLHGLHIYNEINTTRLTTRNNHAYGEAVALFLLGKHFGEKKWEKRGIKIFNEFSFLIDNFGDCVEESSNYHFFITQMLVIAYSADSEDRLQIGDKLGKSLSSLSHITDAKKRIISYGDCDNSFFYNFSNEPDILLKKIESNAFSLGALKKNYILNNKKKSIQVFYHGNFKLILLTGQEKYHAHSHALSYTLLYKEEEIVVDPGTFVYNANPKKRKYFRSSAAHNCPSADGKDHSQQITNFRLRNEHNKVYYSYKDGKHAFLLKTRRDKILREIMFIPNGIVIEDRVLKKNIVSLITFCPGVDITQKNKNIFIVNNVLKINFLDDIYAELMEGPISTTYNNLRETSIIGYKSSLSKVSYEITEIEK